MRIIHYDEGYSWDDPNIRFADPSYILEPGDEGYTPPAGAPKPPRKRRTIPLSSQQTTINNNTTMNPYPFITRTGTQNQVTTSRQSRGTKTQGQFYAELTTRIGTQPLTIPLVFKTGFELINEWITEGWTIAPIEDILGFFLPSGGSFEDTNVQPTFDNMNHKPACNWGDAGRGWVAGNITYENQGHQGRIKPEVIRVTDNWTGQPDHYTGGKSVHIVLGNKKGRPQFNRSLGCKVRFRKADGTLVEATDYGAPGTTEIDAQVPAGTTGNITEVIVSCLINGTLQDGSYTTIVVA